MFQLEYWDGKEWKPFADQRSEKQDDGSVEVRWTRPDDWRPGGIDDNGNALPDNLYFSREAERFEGAAYQFTNGRKDLAGGAIPNPSIPAVIHMTCQRCSRGVSPGSPSRFHEACFDEYGRLLVDLAYDNYEPRG